MVDHSRLHQALASFARIVHESYEIGDALYLLTDQAVAVLSCAGAGVAIRTEAGKLEFVTATDEPITHIEERQIVAGQGPCYEAFTTGEPATSTDLRTESRWPDYCEVALEKGAAAVAGIPLSGRDEIIGALNLYWDEPHQLSDEELQAAGLLADVAAGYIVNLRVITDAERLTKQLQHALDSRVIIEQAKGMIAERHGIPPQEAFELLRHHARSTNRRIHDLAGEVVAGELEL